MKLTEWLVLYVRHKDMFDKKLVDQKEDGSQITFTFKDRKMTAHLLDELAVVPVSGETLVATLHTKENVKFLLDHWPEFSKDKELTLAFVHPGRNEKWIVKPHLHSSITENVEQGIWSMSKGVSYV